MKTHILCSVTFFQKLRLLWDNVEKYLHRGATNDVTIWRIRVACWISKATCTYAHAHAHAPGYHMHARTHGLVILIAFPRQKWFANAPQCYVILTSPVLYHLQWVAASLLLLVLRHKSGALRFTARTTSSIILYHETYLQQDRQCTHNVTLRRVQETIVVEKQ